MTQRIVQSPHEHVMAQRYVESLTPPYTLSVRMASNPRTSTSWPSATLSP